MTQGVSYFTGYHPMSIWGYTGTGYLYPDPEEQASVPPGLTNYASMVASDSPFDGGNANAVIRSLFIAPQTSAAFIVIADHGGTRRFLQYIPQPYSPLQLPGFDLLCPGGFSVYVSGAPIVSIAYEVIGKG